jgi:hypothetical protein
MTNSCGRTLTGKTRTVWAASKGAKTKSNTRGIRGTGGDREIKDEDQGS